MAGARGYKRRKQQRPRLTGPSFSHFFYVGSHRPQNLNHKENPVKILPTILTVLTLTGCAVNEGKSMAYSLGVAMASQVSTDFIKRKMGYPDNQFTMPDGLLVWEYTQERNVTTPKTTWNYADLGTSYSIGGGKKRYYCTLFLEFRDDKFVNWTHKGNNCDLY